LIFKALKIRVSVVRFRPWPPIKQGAFRSLGTLSEHLCSESDRGDHSQDAVSNLESRDSHARLAVGAASTLAVFLFETHEATKGAS
jgi:hypothetical protein